MKDKIQEFIDEYLFFSRREAPEKLKELIKEACIDFKFNTHGLKNAIEPYRSYIIEAIEAEYDDYIKQQNK